MSDPVEAIVVEYIDLFGTVPTHVHAPQMLANDHTRTAIGHTTPLDSKSADGYRSNAQRTIALADILSGVDATTVRLIMDNARDNEAVREQLQIWLTEYRSNKAGLQAFLDTPTGQAAMATMAANMLDTATATTQASADRNNDRAQQAAANASQYSAADWRLAESNSGQTFVQQSTVTGPYETGTGTAPKEFYDSINAALDAHGIVDPAARANWVLGYETLVGRESGFDPKALNDWDSNWDKGTPSIGYAQTIGPTFAGNHVPGTPTDIRDGTANLAASINYVIADYGVLPDGSNLTERVQQADPNRPAHGY